MGEMTTDNRTNEVWKPIPGFEGHYEVSDQGRVRSLDRHVRRGTGMLWSAGRVLVSTPNDSGHHIILLYLDRKRTYLQVHRIVAKVFLGEGAEGEMVCHKNGDPDDNRALNLYWGTMSDNQLDSVRHGTHNMARKTHCIRGHEFTPENTYATTGTVSQRICRACVKIRHEERKARKAA